MSTNEPRVALDGSERTGIPNAREIGPADPSERLEVTVRVRSARRRQPIPAVSGEPTSLPIGGRHHPDRAEFQASAGADPAEIAQVQAFARRHGLDVLEADLGQRRVAIAGTVADLEAAFGVSLRRYEIDGQTYRGRTGPITIPASLRSIIQGVFGLDDRPQARPHFRVFDPATTGHVGAARPATVVEQSFTPAQVARLYNFITGVDGRGETIGLIELGGGLRPADLDAYFDGQGLSRPVVTSVSIDGGRDEPTTPDSADGEVMLDIEVAGSVAPGARIVVYFAPNTDRGFLDAITHAVHDDVHSPSVISISWGGPESSWTAQAMLAMDDAFADAATLGVTVTCASGDDGSDDRVGDGRAHADFPASSPHVLACGGTRITATGGGITNERTWNDGAAGGASGGGISAVFAPPPYQSGAHLPPTANPDGRAGRGVPDVAGDASPASGYAVRVDGRAMVIGGTSAVAPLYAGLVALLNQKLDRPIGFLNPVLYGVAAGAVDDITEGGNGAYSARVGWDACTGLGRIDGTKLLIALEPPA